MGERFESVSTKGSSAVDVEVHSHLRYVFPGESPHAIGLHTKQSTDYGGHAGKNAATGTSPTSFTIFINYKKPRMLVSGTQLLVLKSGYCCLDMPSFLFLNSLGFFLILLLDY